MPIGTRRQFLSTCLTGIGSVGYSAFLANRAFGAAGDDSPQARFFEAIQSGELANVRALVGEHAELLSAKDGAGRSGFAVAYLSRHAEVGEFLRGQGYKPDLHEAALALDWDLLDEVAKASPEVVNETHPIGGSAMYAAAYGGAGNQIWRVYQYGGEPNAVGGSGHGAPLFAALGHPDLGTAELCAAMLLGNGASADADDVDGNTALHAAAQRGSAVIVEMLVRKGARVDAKNDRGKTAMEIAERNHAKEVVAVLVHHESIARDHSTSRLAYDVDGKPFKPARLSDFPVLTVNRVVGAAHFRFDELRRYVDKQPELAKSIAATTEGAVEACGHTGQRAIVEYLLERGAPYSLPTAVMRTDTKRVKELLDEDPKRIHERGPHDFALLWYPIIGGGSVELAELLLRAGAQVEQQHHLGTTALHWAVRGGQRDMVQLLIENGADVNRVGRKFNPKGETPLQMAVAGNRDGIAEILRSHGARS